jgi:hypothetical protein
MELFCMERNKRYIVALEARTSAAQYHISHRPDRYLYLEHHATGDPTPWFLVFTYIAPSGPVDEGRGKEGLPARLTVRPDSHFSLPLLACPAVTGYERHPVPECREISLLIFVVQ